MLRRWRHTASHEPPTSQPLRPISCLVPCTGSNVTSDHPERPGAGADPAHRYRRTLDNLLFGVQIIAFDWTYFYLNPAAAAHGHRPRGLVGQRIFDAYPGIEHTPLFQRLRACMEERTRQVFENLFTFP